MTRSEPAATGRRSTRRFQALSRGKTGQRDAPRTGRPVVVAAAASSAASTVRAAASLTRRTLRRYARRRMASTGDSDPPAPVPCSACRGTGRVTSNLGGTPHEVACPWCEGGGRRLPEHDAQAAGGADKPDGDGDGPDLAA